MNKILTTKMKKNAQIAIRVGKTELNEKLEYSENSISKIDKILEKYFSKNNSNLELTAQIFGALFGEIIRKVHGGNWDYYIYEGQKLIALINIGKKRTTIFPVNKISKRIENGKSDDLNLYYKALKSDLFKDR